MKLPRTKYGFSLVEMSIVLVIIGLLIGLATPLLRMVMKQNKLVEERNVIAETKQALIGHALLQGGFPTPEDDDTLPSVSLGVHAVNPYQKPLYYDIATELDVATTGGDVSAFCEAIPTALSSGNAPRIWSGADYSDEDLASPVAFVIVSSGANYQVDGENDFGDSSDRIYENPSKTHDDVYDDVVSSYSLTEICTLCTNQGYTCGAGGGGGGGGGESCTASGGQYCTSITNNTGETIYWVISSNPQTDTGCQALANGETANAPQNPGGHELLLSTDMDEDDGICSHSDRFFEEKLKDLDDNDDNSADVTCTSTDEDDDEDNCSSI